MEKQKRPIKTVLAAVAKAQESYFMANGKYANDFDELDIDLPLSPGGSDNICGTAVASQRRGNDFVVTLSSTGGISAWWTQGPYQCAGFFYRDISEGLICRERAVHFTSEAGSFCKRIEKATFSTELAQESPYFRWYILP